MCKRSESAKAKIRNGPRCPVTMYRFVRKCPACRPSKPSAQDRVARQLAARRWSMDEVDPIEDWGYIRSDWALLDNPHILPIVISFKKDDGVEHKKKPARHPGFPGPVNFPLALRPHISPAHHSGLEGPVDFNLVVTPPPSR